MPVSSINGDSTQAQKLTGGSGITITDDQAGGHTIGLAPSQGSSSLGVGSVVLYSPTAREWPMSSASVPAIVTGYDPNTLTANLTILPDGVGYVLSKKSVTQGSSPGQYQPIS